MKILSSVFFFLLVGSIFISCKKDSSGSQQTPSKPKVGLIQQLLIDSPAFKITKGNLFDQDLRSNTSCDVGFIFKPLKDIKIISVGYKAAEAGEYKILLRKLDKDFRVLEKDTLHMESLSINNTQDFQYTELNSELALNKDQEYVIYCYNKTANSIYNALYTNSDPASSTWIFPMVRDGIMIEEHYSALYGGDFLYNYGIVRSNSMRGLVDFKYK